MDKGIKIGLLYGGPSYEHAVSCRSASNVAHQLLKLGYKVIPIAIDSLGRWSVQKLSDQLVATFNSEQEVLLSSSNGLIYKNEKLDLDAIFPVTHGYGGEDGRLQGLLDLMKLPYVGSDQKASTIAMHKELAKMIVKEAQIATLPFVTVDENYDIEELLKNIKEKVGLNILLKPEDGGSSVGVKPLFDVDKAKLSDALQFVFKYTTKIIIEPLLTDFVELECAILAENSSVIGSLPGQIINPKGVDELFLSYEQKYLSSQSAYIKVPAGFDNSVLHTVSALAIEIGQLIGIKGYARVDFLYEPKENLIWFNEINTLPGMTTKSHFPLLAASCGYDWPRLIPFLVDESLKRPKKENRYFDEFK